MHTDHVLMKLALVLRWVVSSPTGPPHTLSEALLTLAGEKFGDGFQICHNFIRGMSSSRNTNGGADV